MTRHCIKAALAAALIYTVGLYGSAAAAATDTEVREFMEGYLSSFDTGHAGDVTDHYAAPMLMLAPNGDIREYETRKDIRLTVKKWKRYLFHNGFDHSKWVKLNVRALSDNTALASTVFERFNSKGKMFQRGAATYTLRKDVEGWKIWLIHIHDPEKVFAFN